MIARHLEARKRFGMSPPQTLRWALVWSRSYCLNLVLNISTRVGGQDAPDVLG